jgi:flagellar basal-body rod protein FlgB
MSIKKDGGAHMELFKSTLVSTMDKSLDGLWRRQEVISDNIANFETPGYKRKYVSFEDNLKSALESKIGGKNERVARLDDSKISVKEEKQENMRLDGNGVDLEKENIDMVRTTYQYMYSQRVLNDHFSRLRYAISEGRR